MRIAAINAFLQENITGISLVQLFHREDDPRRKFAGLNAAHRDAFLKSVFYYSVYFPVVEFLEALALALILWYGGGEALQGALTLGALVAFIQYGERFFRPIRDLSDRYNILQGAMASSERIFELLDTRPGSLNPPRRPAVARRARDRAERLRSSSATSTSATSPAGRGAEGASPSRAPRGIGRAGRPYRRRARRPSPALLSRFYDVSTGAVLVDGRMSAGGTSRAPAPGRHRSAGGLSLERRDPA